MSDEVDTTQGLSLDRKTMDERFIAMQSDMDKRFEQVDGRFTSLKADMDKRFQQVDDKLDNILDRIDRRIDEGLRENRAQSMRLFTFAMMFSAISMIVWSIRTG